MNNKKFIVAALGLALLFYFSAFVIVQVNASPGRWYVYLQMNASSSNPYYYGVRGYNTVVNQTIVYNSGVASFYGVGQPNTDWLAMGIMQGKQPNGGPYYSSPQFYYDYQKRTVPGFVGLGATPLNTNVRYGVYTSRQFSPPWPPPGDAHATWYAYNSYLSPTYSITDFYYAWGIPVGESESHDNLNTLNYHYWGCQWADMGLIYHDFVYPATAYYMLPYHFTGGYTDWRSSGPS